MLVAIVGACGKKTGTAVTKQDAGAGKTIAAPIALPPLGVDKISRFNFLWNDGGNAYDKALTAYKAKARDWAAVRSACELAVQKDPQHLDAQRLLAVVLSQQGDHAAAVDHIVAAIAGDYFKYGVAFAADPELEAFRGTPHGQAVAALTTQIHDEYLRRIKAGLWLIGRRGPFKWPAKDGVQTSSSRGEVYVYDRDSHRYLRLTHTDHQVAGLVRAPSGAEIAILGFDKIDHPKDDAQPPLLARAWVAIVDPVEWKPIGKRVELASTRAAAVGFGPGDQLLAGTAPANGRWGLGDWTVSSIDKSTGKLAKVAQPLPAPRIELTLDEGRVVRDLAGVDAAWTGDPAIAPSLKVGNVTIHVPESHVAAHDSVALAPDKAHVAFATAVDPCAKDMAPSLYVADSKTGALKHLLTAKSRFATRWLDATTLAYDDGDGDIRLWDPSTGREAMKVDDKNGLALDVLSLASVPQCKQAPTKVETGSAGSDDTLPPEETTP
ncbi:MAG TPA: hypothetical protein VFQ65_25415 [Kofleriaceae bacterium]|nr:hypothetical protein [Kofleriaceae bacterium]